MYMYIYMSVYIIYTNTYMQTIIIDENRGHEFEGAWGRMYGRFLREEMEGRKVVKLQSPK